MEIITNKDEVKITINLKELQNNADLFGADTEMNDFRNQRLDEYYNNVNASAFNSQLYYIEHDEEEIFEDVQLEMEEYDINTVVLMSYYKNDELMYLKDIMDIYKYDRYAELRHSINGMIDSNPVQSVNEIVVLTTSGISDEDMIGILSNYGSVIQKQKKVLKGVSIYYVSDTVDTDDVLYFKERYDLKPEIIYKKDTDNFKSKNDENVALFNEIYNNLKKDKESAIDNTAISDINDFLSSWFKGFTMILTEFIRSDGVVDKDSEIIMINPKRAISDIGREVDDLINSLDKDAVLNSVLIISSLPDLDLDSIFKKYNFSHICRDILTQNRTIYCGYFGKPVKWSDFYSDSYLWVDQK